MPKFILEKIEVIFPKLATIKNMCLFWDYFSNFITHSKIILCYIDVLTSVFFFYIQMLNGGVILFVKISGARKGYKHSIEFGQCNGFHCIDLFN